MSHTVNIRRRIVTTTTTTVTNGSTMNLNIDYLKTVWAGPLALLQGLIGIVVVGLCSGSASRYDFVVISKRDLYLMTIAASCFITTILMFVSNLFHAATWEMLKKTLFELVYHCFAFFMYLVGAVAVLVEIHTDNYGGSRYTELLIASIFAIINTVLYCVSAIFSYKGFKSK